MNAPVNDRVRCVTTFGLFVLGMLALHWLGNFDDEFSSYGVLLACSIPALASGKPRCIIMVAAGLLLFFLMRLSPLQALTLSTLFTLTGIWVAAALPRRSHVFHLADARQLLLRGALAGCALAALADALLIRVADLPLQALLVDGLVDFLSGSLLMMLLLPLLHAYAGGRWRWSCAGELLLIALLSALVCVLVSRNGAEAQALLLLLFPLMIWATQHRRYPGFLVVAFATTGVMVVTRGMLAGPADLLAWLADLVFLNALAATGLLLAASGSDEREMARTLAAEQQKLARLLDNVPTYIFIEDESGNLTYANRAFAALTGYPAEDLLGKPAARICSLLSQSGAPQSGNQPFEWRIRGATGEHVLLGSCFPLTDGAGQACGQGFAATDISEQLLADEQAHLTAKVFENASEGILITDGSGIIIAVNAAFSHITGYSAADAIGRRSRMFLSQDPRNSELQSILRQGGHWQGEMLDRHRKGHSYPAWLSISAVCGNDGRVTHCVGVFSDITARKESEARLQYLASHDPLTALFNRAGLQEQLNCRIRASEQSHRPLALLFIDLDRFKGVNDSYGHALGDALLQQVALRLQASLKEQDLVARLGGDEFTVVLEDVPSHAALAAIADCLVGELARPYRVDGHELYLTSSIGVSRYPEDAGDAQSLLRTADIAMYRAKELGKNNFQFYASELNTRVSERMKLESEMRRAMRERQFQLHYQPQYNLSNRQLIGVEALLRWDSPSRGQVSPSVFIPAAEECGLIIQLGEWILRTACLQMRQWIDQGVDVPVVAVNLSARQFVVGKLVAIVQQALQDACIPASRLELEITESMIMANPDEAVAILRELRDMGVKVSIDDFGTGYSSLSNLRNFPLDALKIDRSFILNLPHDDDNAAITAAIVALARKLRLTVVAEGVESAEQAEYLCGLGCHVAQGFHYSPAIAAALLPKYLQGRAQPEPLALVC